MAERLRSGGIAAWSIRRPIAVTMLALAIIVPGLISLGQLHIDLLPELIYPSIRVRVLDEGVPARIMEDQVTRLLEEQLAITEGAVAVESFTREGRSAVDLSFPYGTDIDTALRDASNRLDRAKRFLPQTIEPPVIYKLDPSQIPVLELVVSSDRLDSVELYEWVDYVFSKSLINLPGVASVEVGGGQAREIAIDIDQERMASAGLTFQDVSEQITAENSDATGGSLVMSNRELNTRIAGRFAQVSDLERLPLRPKDGAVDTALRVDDVADIRNSQANEQLRIRVDGVSGVKLSVHKQPQANTVAVVDSVLQHIDWMRSQAIIPMDIAIKRVNDQAVYIRHALRNATYAAFSGAVLAMSVVYLFLGNLRRTLIVGSAIPLAILMTFMLMQLGGLTLNIMTLGGLALGIGILVDSTIVMLENIYRHQRQGSSALDEAIRAAEEVNSPIVASTTTNLAAVMPFLFIGGLLGLIFRELIFTISAAIASSMVVALTLVPALATRAQPPPPNRLRLVMDNGLKKLQKGYTGMTTGILRYPWLPLIFLLPALAWAVHFFNNSEEAFLPPIDEGQVRIRITGDTGMQLDEMDQVVRKIESFLAQQAEVETVFTQAGGFVYGRTQWNAGNQATISVQLVNPQLRKLNTEQWVKGVQEKFSQMSLPGFNFKIWSLSRVQGIRLGRGDEQISVRISGPNLDQLTDLGSEVVERLHDMDGLRNVKHNYEDIAEELEVVIDRIRAADLGVSIEEISRAVQIAVDGLVITDFIDGDRKLDVRLRLPPEAINGREDLSNVIVTLRNGQAIRLRDIANLRLTPAPANIMRDKQVRTVEITASIQADYSLETVMQEIQQRLQTLDMPPGYSLYDDGAAKALQEGQRLGNLLLMLAIILVFIVLAVQYESLKNPTIILLSIPFAIIGVALGLWTSQLPLSMPVWLGMIILAGIVVNNAIVLVEQIEIEREQGSTLIPAIVQAARYRLRPILMTTLTTVAGMTPLALGLGEGSEMLQPLAVTIVWGLSFSTLVSLVIVPAIYRMIQGRHKLYP
jgi:multidrug efflux pump subunit AcrB